MCSASAVRALVDSTVASGSRLVPSKNFLADLPGDVGSTLVDPFKNPADAVQQGTGKDSLNPFSYGKGGTMPGGEKDSTNPEDEEDAPNMLLGRLASGMRTQGQGRGIGANILTGGSGLQANARTKRKTLLGG